MKQLRAINVKQDSLWERTIPAMSVLWDAPIVQMQILAKNASFAICSSTQPKTNASCAMLTAEPATTAKLASSVL